jgi:hypothetical protein
MVLCSKLVRSGVHKSWALIHPGDGILHSGTDIFVITIALYSCTYKNVYQLACTKHEVSDDSEVYSSLQNCGALVWNLLHVTLLVPKIWRWPVHCLENLSTPGSDTAYITVHNIYSNNCTTIKRQ